MAVVFQPGAVTMVARVQLPYQLPKPFAMIPPAKMRNLVRNHILHNGCGRKHQAPGNTDRSGGTARPPAAPGIGKPHTCGHKAACSRTYTHAGGNIALRLCTIPGSKVFLSFCWLSIRKKKSLTGMEGERACGHNMKWIRHSEKR